MVIRCDIRVGGLHAPLTHFHFSAYNSETDHADQLDREKQLGVVVIWEECAAAVRLLDVVRIVAC